MIPRRSRPAAATPALQALERAGVPYRVAHFAASSPLSSAFPSSASSARGYGAQAADRLGLDPAVVFKTLMVQAPDGTLAAAVVPVSGTLDLRATATALGVKKVAMADPALAERRTGYVVGGMSPVGQRQSCPTVIDASALDQPVLHVSAGQRGLEVELAPADLVAVTRAVVAAIASVR